MKMKMKNKSWYDKPSENSVMREVYRNGELLIEEDLATIRARAELAK